MDQNVYVAAVVGILAVITAFTTLVTSIVVLLAASAFREARNDRDRRSGP